MLKKILDGVSAGLMVSIGCAVFLACDKVVGAVLFTIALLVICYRGYSLYTGKIGFIPFSHKKEDFSVLLLGLLGNAIGMIVFGLLISVALPNLKERAITICTAKLKQQSWEQTAIRGLFCGVLMFIAVYVYKENKSIVAILFGIPTFILCGFEHSVADMGYFAIANMFSLDVVLFIILVVIGNTIGSMILPYLSMAKDKKVVAKKEIDDAKAS